MSSLGFLTRNGQARVSGRESGKFSVLLRDLMWRTVERVADPYERAGRSLLRDAAAPLPDWVVRDRGTNFGRGMRLHLHNAAGRPDEYVNLPGTVHAATLFDVHVNTVIAEHSDPVALAVRLAAQSGCNAWIDGTDRLWLADLIDAGRNTPYPAEVADHADLRRHPLFADEPSVNGSYDGWQNVAAMLRAGTGTVVLESSATGGFPSRVWAAEEGQDRDWFRRWWNDATPGQRWDASERGLRAETAESCPLLQIRPDTLHHPGFGFAASPTWQQVAEAWTDPERTPPA